MTAKVTLIHLDSATPDLLEQWSDAGLLPALARIRDEGATIPLDSRTELLQGSPWHELNTGRSAEKSGRIAYYAQLRTGELTPRPLEVKEVGAAEQYWCVAGRQERRVAAIDPVLGVTDPEFRGVELLGWSVHDAPFGASARPAPLLEELVLAHGEPELRVQDGRYHACIFQEPGEPLVAALEAEAVRKGRLIVELLARQPLDLLVCGFSEAHCAGHLLWHLHEKAERSGRDPRTDPLLRVYRSLDDQVALLRDAIGPDAKLLVVSSAGILPAFAGGHLLLPMFLERLGLGPGRSRRLQASALVPGVLRRWLRALVPQPLRNRLALGPASHHELRPGDRTRVFPIYNGRSGALRLNLIGREPYGTVRPGAEAEGLLEELCRELRALRDPRSSEPIVEQIVNTRQEYGADCHPDLPDLLVAFRRDLGLVHGARSERVGLLRTPAESTPWEVVGDHGGGARLFARGLEGGLPERASLVDVAPTVLRLLGVERPAWIDGRSLVP